MAPEPSTAVEDTIESTELTQMSLPHPHSSLKNSGDNVVAEAAPEVMAEPEQRRSTFRTLPVMAALFVSMSPSVSQAWRSSHDALYSPLLDIWWLLRFPWDKWPILQWGRHASHGRLTVHFARVIVYSVYWRPQHYCRGYCDPNDLL